MDVEKIFGTILLGELPRKLEFLRVLTEPNYWTKPKFGSRTHMIIDNGFTFQICNLGCGVPLGSILCPPLFILYVGDLIGSSN